MSFLVRTTLTLDDDVAAQLRRLAKDTGRPFKQVVNDALRAGLASRSAASPQDAAFPTYSLGLRPGLNLDRARHLAASMEDEEIVRELELRK
jgi:hypothetical protein